MSGHGFGVGFRTAILQVSIHYNYSPSTVNWVRICTYHPLLLLEEELLESHRMQKLKELLVP